MEKALSSSSHPLGPGEAFRRVIECISTGVLQEGQSFSLSLNLICRFACSIVDKGTFWKAVDWYNFSCCAGLIPIVVVVVVVVAVNSRKEVNNFDLSVKQT